MFAESPSSSPAAMGSFLCFQRSGRGSGNFVFGSRRFGAMYSYQFRMGLPSGESKFDSQPPQARSCGQGSLSSLQRLLTFPPTRMVTHFQSDCFRSCGSCIALVFVACTKPNPVLRNGPLCPLIPQWRTHQSPTLHAWRQQVPVAVPRRRRLLLLAVEAANWPTVLAHARAL